jgi:hypothetical protein
MKTYKVRVIEAIAVPKGGVVYGFGGEKEKSR